MSYWSQWSADEIADMHGIEDDTYDSVDTDLSQDEVDTDLCPNCRNGCNYCLMTGY